MREQDRIRRREGAHGVVERRACLGELVRSEDNFLRGVIGNGLERCRSVQQGEIAAGRVTRLCRFLGRSRGEDQARRREQLVAGEFRGEQRFVLAAVEPTPTCCGGHQPASTADITGEVLDVFRLDLVRVDEHGAKSGQASVPILPVERFSFQACALEVRHQRSVAHHSDLRFCRTRLADRPARGIRKHCAIAAVEGAQVAVVPERHDAALFPTRGRHDGEQRFLAILAGDDGKGLRPKSANSTGRSGRAEFADALDQRRAIGIEIDWPRRGRRASAD